MAIYQRGNNWYVDFTFKGQRVRESIGPSRKDAAKVIAKDHREQVPGFSFPRPPAYLCVKLGHGGS